MTPPEWNSLGITKQLAYVNRLEEINKQKQALIEQLESDYDAVIKRTNCLVYIDPQKNCETLKRLEYERKYGKSYEHHKQ